jgi:hypothetical protein
MITISNKQCNTCKISYPSTTQYFHKHNQQKDGLFGKCKSCRNSKKRNQRLTGKLESLGMTVSEYTEYKRKLEKIRKEEILIQRRRYYLEHRRDRLQATKDHYQANKKQVSNRKSNWYQKENDEMRSMFADISDYEFCEHSTVLAIKQLNHSARSDGWRDIAKEMNKMGYRTKRGKVWTRCSINKFASDRNIERLWT